MALHTHSGAGLLDGYRRARAIFGGIANATSLSLNTTIVPHWIDDTNCFWYRRKTWQGTEFRLVDAKSDSNKKAFDHEILAASLADRTEKTIDSSNLPIEKVRISLSPLRIDFSVSERRFCYQPEVNILSETDVSCLFPKTESLGEKLVSPDKTKAVFVRDHNLWLLDMCSGEENSLTKDGDEFYAYATSPLAHGLSMNQFVQALWSPDSKRILTLQTDRRQVNTTSILHHVSEGEALRPQLREQVCAYTGDEHVEEVRLLSIDVETGGIQEANYRRIPVKRLGAGLFTDQLVWWSADKVRAYFVDQERNGQVVRVIEWNSDSGQTRCFIEETSSTYIQLSANDRTPATLQAIPNTEELIWYSERSGWAHLYLYDLKSGKLKHSITEGNWLVRDILYFDSARRELWIQTAGRDNKCDPYYRDICRVSIDTGKLTAVATGDTEYTVLAPRNIDYFWHKIFDEEVEGDTNGISPDGSYIVTCKSRIDQIPVSQLLDRNGKVLMELEVADLSGFPEGWSLPEPVKLMGSDSETATYGAVFKPSDFSPEKQYPIIDASQVCFPLAMTPKGLLTNDINTGFFFLYAASLAELGFIVVLIDGRGLGYRDRVFTNQGYGWLGAVNNTEDRIAGIKLLAAQRPYMDINRVGFFDYGSDGGTLMRYPDFYRVSVCFGVLDARLMAAAIYGEHLEGDGREGIAAEPAEEIVDKLEGKLLLMHGLLNPLFPAAGTFRLVEALQKANKDFDLQVFPKLSHGPDEDAYGCRRAWDYFVKHLQGEEPPKEFNLGSSS